MDKTQLILYGNGPLLNRGCEAIVRSTIDLLDSVHDNISFISAPYFTGGIDADYLQLQQENLKHLSPKPPSKRYTLRWLVNKLSSTSRARGHISFDHLLESSSACIIVGGDNLSLDYGEWLPKVQFDVMNYLCDMNVKTFIIGASIGPFNNNNSIEQYAIKTLKRVTHIYVRERLTEKYLNDLGVKENVKWAPDPAFTLSKSMPTLPEDIGDLIEKNCVGINLSPLFEKKYGGMNVWIEQATELVKAVNEKLDVPIILIPHVFNHSSNDFEFLSSVFAKIKQECPNVYLLPPNYNSCELKWVISKMDLFIGARTHSTVAALSESVPTVSLGYSIKAEGINRDIFGSDEWVVPLDKLSPEYLSEKVEKLWSLRHKVRDSLVKTMPIYQQYARDVAAHIITNMKK
jgi:colanic acid/amylovoran biosynthesis protein